LGVKPATLYAYVSRGLVHRVPGADGRSSRFDEREIARLARRSPGTRRTTHDLLIASDVTLIEATGHRYRGQRALDLVEAGVSFEQVAGLLWTGSIPGGPGGPASPGSPVDPVGWSVGPAARRAALAAQAALPGDALSIDRHRVAIAAAAVTDPLRFDTRPAAVIAHAPGLVALLVEAMPLLGSAPAGKPSGSSIAARLWPRLSPGRATAAAVGALDGALVLLADHELAASTVAVRIAAAYEADPYAAVSAGLGVMSGARHGGASLGSEDLLDEVMRTGDAGRVVGERLRSGQLLHGFGQPLYPNGDPRFSAAVDLARRAAPDAKVFAALEALVDVAAAQQLPPPNVDLGLATFSRAAGMGRGGGLAIFSIARCAGWLAHVIEEYEHRTRFRLRATPRRETGAAASAALRMNAMRGASGAGEL
jgi:citrate synthase